MLNNLVAQLGTGAGASASSFESIATQTLGSASASVTFSSIPSTYQYIQLRCLTRDTTAVNGSQDILMRLNGDSANNYAFHNLVGDGSTASAAGSATISYINLKNAAIGNSSTASTFGATIINIHDYASTNKNKTARFFAGADANTASTNFRVTLGSGVWLSTSAVSSITLIAGGATLAAGSTFALYGIKG